MQRTRFSQNRLATYGVAAVALLVLALVAPTVATSWVMALILIVLIVAGIEVVRRIVLGRDQERGRGIGRFLGRIRPGRMGRGLRPALEWHGRG